MLGPVVPIAASLNALGTLVPFAELPDVPAAWICIDAVRITTHGREPPRCISDIELTTATQQLTFSGWLGARHADRS